MKNDTIGVQVMLFASLREVAGEETFALSVPDGWTLGDLWDRLVERHPGLDGRGSSVAWAVNHSWAKADQKLSDGDLVAVLPPISGGTSEGESTHG